VHLSGVPVPTTPAASAIDGTPVMNTAKQTMRALRVILVRRLFRSWPPLLGASLARALAPNRMNSVLRRMDNVVHQLHRDSLCASGTLSRARGAGATGGDEVASPPSFGGIQAVAAVHMTAFLPDAVGAMEPIEVIVLSAEEPAHCRLRDTIIGGL